MLKRVSQNWLRVPGAVSEPPKLEGRNVIPAIKGSSVVVRVRPAHRGSEMVEDDVGSGPQFPAWRAASAATLLVRFCNCFTPKIDL